MSHAAVEVTGIVRGGKTEAETTVVVKDAGGISVGSWLSVGNPPEWPDDTARAVERVAYRQDVIRIGDVIVADGAPSVPIVDDDIAARFQRTTNVDAVGVGKRDAGIE